MKRYGLLLLILVLATPFMGCTYVEPGYVGIKVNMYGDQKGVEDFPIQTGRVWYNPWTEDIYTYPTFNQNASWSHDRSGDGIDQSISFGSIEGARITASVGVSYSMQAEKVPENFIKFRLPIEDITETYLRNKVQDAFNRVGGRYKAVEIFGEKKQVLLTEVKTSLEEELGQYGFVFDTVAFTGTPIAEERVMESINQVIQATQRAIEAENKVRQIEAEAKQKIAEAKGEATSIMEIATAQATANRELAQSITPELIQYQMMEKWDGVAPRFMGGGSDTSLLLSIPEGTASK